MTSGYNDTTISYRFSNYTVTDFFCNNEPDVLLIRKQFNQTMIFIDFTVLTFDNDEQVCKVVFGIIIRMTYFIYFFFFLNPVLFSTKASSKLRNLFQHDPVIIWLMDKTIDVVFICRQYFFDSALSQIVLYFWCQIFLLFIHVNLLFPTLLHQIHCTSSIHFEVLFSSFALSFQLSLVRLISLCTILNSPNRLISFDTWPISVRSHRSSTKCTIIINAVKGQTSKLYASFAFLGSQSRRNSRQIRVFNLEQFVVFVFCKPFSSVWRFARIKNVLIYFLFVLTFAVFFLFISRQIVITCDRKRKNGLKQFWRWWTCHHLTRPTIRSKNTSRRFTGIHWFNKALVVCVCVCMNWLLNLIISAHFDFRFVQNKLIGLKLCRKACKKCVSLTFKNRILTKTCLILFRKQIL